MNRRHRGWWLGLTLLVVVVASGAAFVVRGPFASGSGTATVTIESGSVLPGGSDTVRLEVQNVDAPGIGAVTVDLRYDNTVVDATACVKDPGSPLDSALCKPDYQPDKVRMSGLSPAGASGNIPLADITFQAIGQVGECSSLEVQVETFTDPSGTPIARTVHNGQFCIAAPSPSPSPTGTGTATVTATPTPTPTRTPTPTPTRTPTPTPTSPPGPTVRIGFGSANPGDSDTVALDTLNVPSPGVGAVTVDVTYNPAVKTVTGCTADPQHRFDTALCNKNYRSNTIRFSGMSAAGLSGSPRLADVTFRASGTRGDCTTLDVSVATFTKPDGSPITPVSTQDGTNCVGTPAPTPTATPTPTPGPDDDADGLPNTLDPCPNDDDCDDDGLMDGSATGSEDLNNNGVVDPGETDPENWDTDGDGLSDGLERGLTAPEGQDTNADSPHWQPDADPSTKTDPLSADTDGDTIPDGEEDSNGNGAVDAGEGNPGLFAVALVQGWTQTCYLGTSAPIEQALGSVADQVLAVYRLGAAQTFERWFPGRPDVSTITTVGPYDQLFVLASEAAPWSQQFSGASQGSAVLAQGWNAVCYSGVAQEMDTATAPISRKIGVIYTLVDQTWVRYVPNRPEASEMTQCARLDALLVLVTDPTGAIWVFSP